MCKWTRMYYVWFKPNSSQWHLLLKWTCNLSQFQARLPQKYTSVLFYHSPNNPICTLSGVHTFVCVPLEHLEVFFQAVRFCTKTIIPSILQMVMTAIILISGTSLSCFCVWESQQWRFTKGPTRCIFGLFCWWISPPCAKFVFIPHLFWHFIPSEGLWMVPLDAKPPLFPGIEPISAAPCTKTQTTQSVQLTTPALFFLNVPWAAYAAN